MRYLLSKVVVATAVFAATVSVQASAESDAKTIVVESPADLPELAQRHSEAMYLHRTNDGRAILYLEQDNGHRLAILDVTDPAAIRTVGLVTTAAASPFDFVRRVGDSAALIQYRDHSGFALVSFKKYKHPIVRKTSQFQDTATVEHLGQGGLLSTSISSESMQAQTDGKPTPTAQEYRVMDVSDPASPSLLTTIDGVRQSLDRPSTGTVFLLSDSGVTVIRRPRVEEDYKVQLAQQKGN